MPPQAQKKQQPKNKAQVLAATAAELTNTVRLLSQQNERLRAKQHTQLGMLSNYDDTLHHMGVLLCQLADQDSEGAADSVSVLAAAMMDLRVKELLQQLRADHGACSSSGKESNSSSRGNAEGSGSGELVGSQGLEQVAAQARPLSRTQRLWASITPEAVLDMKGISTTQLAERFKAAVGRIALVECCSGKQLVGGIEAAVDAYGVTAILAMVAADEQFLEFTCLNLDTMQPAAPPGTLWAQILSSAGLTSTQRQQVALTFDCYKDRRAALLQEQAQTVQQLQVLLGGQQPADASGQTTQPQLQAVHWSSSGSTGTAAAVASFGPAVAVPAAAGAALSPCSTGSSAEGAAGGEEPALSAGRGTDAAAAVACAGCADALPSLLHEPAQGVGCTSSMDPCLLNLEAAEQAEQLLRRLQRNIRRQREYSRQLVYMWMDLLTTKQHAAALLAAFPFSIKIPAVCALVWQQERDKQQKKQRD